MEKNNNLNYTGKDLENKDREKIYNIVYKYVFNFFFDEEITKDLTQEIIVKILLILQNKKYEEQGKFENRIIKLTRNHVLDFFRKQKREVISIEDINNDKDSLRLSVMPDAEENMIQKEKEKKLFEAMSFLPLEQQEVIFLHIFKGEKFKNIAEITKTSINTVLGRYRYARNSLFKILSKSINN